MATLRPEGLRDCGRLMEARGILRLCFRGASTRWLGRRQCRHQERCAVQPGVRGASTPGHAAIHSFCRQVIGWFRYRRACHRRLIAQWKGTATGLSEISAPARALLHRCRLSFASSRPSAQSRSSKRQPSSLETLAPSLCLDVATAEPLA
jgi:hypothetical protein